MVRRKLDNRIRVLIENGVAQGHRTFFVIVGNKSRDQVVYIHHMLSKASLKQAEVLWCYKKELSLSSDRRKRMQQMKTKRDGGMGSFNEDDPFEMFVSLTNIRYTYYKETHKILGNTFKMCVIQDFESMTPNILCRTIETVEGGGVIVLLLQSVTSLKQLFTLNMDVHARYRTEAHQNVVPRFNERFILSLASCNNCIVMDDQMRVLPISSHYKDIVALPPKDEANKFTPAEQELKDLKESTKGTQPLGTLIALCKSIDQAKVVLEFVMVITAKTLNTTVTLTAARGRGKSAAMGIALAGAIAFGYSNIYVTSPTPENLNTLFQFVLTGLKALNYEDINDFQVLRSSDKDHNKAVLRVTISRDRQQVIQYISPSEASVLGTAELVVVDEAAAIPLPMVKSLLGPYLVFLSSTVCGYEGTGRSLSLKLIKQLREKKESEPNLTEGKSRKLVELSLEEPIRYSAGDKVEKWLFDLLCLDTKVSTPKNEPSIPDDCQLFYVNRDTLFGYHKVSEKILNAIMSLLVSSHYRNSPDDLQILSDAPAHHLFVLLPKSEGGGLPPVLTVVQVALEGKISKTSIMTQHRGGAKPAGDMIPWTVSGLFLDDDFPKLSGARIVRVATHPDFQGKGYGSKALTLLEEYYTRSCIKYGHEEKPSDLETANTVLGDEDMSLLEEKIEPRGLTKPLFYSLEERCPESLHYIGVSYGASVELLHLWKKMGYTTVYLSQVPNGLTGEHTALMVKVLGEDKKAKKESWLRPFWFNYRKILLNLLPGPFSTLSSPFALSLVTNKTYKNKAKVPSHCTMKTYFNQQLVKRFECYANQQVELNKVSDIWSKLADLYFLDLLPGLKPSVIQMTILLGIGLQRKHPTVIAQELLLDTSVVMAQLYTLSKEACTHLKSVWEQSQTVEDTEYEDDLKKVTTQVAHFAPRPQEDPSAKESVQEIDFSQFGIKTRESVSRTSTQSSKRSKPLIFEESEPVKKPKLIL